MKLSLVAVLIAAFNSVDNARQFAIAAPHGSKTVIVQLFQWNWDSIGQECQEFIGPAGYGFVQGGFITS